jgi:flagellar hook-associated protein 3 FlgL
MISTLDASGQQFLSNLNRISQRMEKAQQRVSTGLKISSVSDEPNSIALLLEGRANLVSTSQTLANLGRYKTEVDAGEQALENAVSLFDKVQTLGAQGASDLQTAAGRRDVAQQLDSLLEQLVGVAGSAVEGRYVFSGDTDQQVPYRYDATLAIPLSAYLGSGSTRLAEHPNGTTFSVALTAQQIFDSADPTKSVFQNIQALSTALKNNDSAAIQTGVDGLAKIAEHLNSELAIYGTTQNKIADAMDFGQTLKVQLQTQIGTFEGADLTQAILELNLTGTQQQAALQARARLPRTMLFDYLG